MRRLFFIIIAAALCCGCEAKVKEYKVEVVREYDHDPGAYTQGLFFDGGKFYESTGQWGESSFRTVDLESGKVLGKIDFDENYFAEGSVMFKGNLYILTWTNKVAFVYDSETLEFKQGFSYPRQGWGITTDGKQLIASDGTSRLYFMDEKLKVDRTVKVTLNGRSVRYLNELEYIDGKIWANVYTTDTILIINPRDGKVVATVDCSGLLPDKLRKPETDVFNGIAQDPDSGKIYVTGKYWPRLYEIKIVEK